MNDWKRQTVKTSDGIDLNFYDFGEGKPVVLIAGYAAPANSWVLQVKPLLEAGFRVICFDRRSHGFSENTEKGQNMERHGKDLDEFLRHLNLQKPLLVGQSQGASTIFSYISQFGDENISGVVDIDQTPKMVNDEEWDKGMYGITPITLPTFFDDPIPSPFYGEPQPEVLAQLAEALAVMESFDRVGTKPLLGDHAAADWRATLKETKVPVLFVAGQNSPFWNCEHAKESASLCQYGESAVISECGHAVNWEQADAFNEVLLNFTKKIFK